MGLVLRVGWIQDLEMDGEYEPLKQGASSDASYSLFTVICTLKVATEINI